jgi:hypothetical protein
MAPVAAPRGRTGRAEALAPLAGAAAAAVAAVIYLGAVDPERPGHYPSCPFRVLTGLYCPGCGSLRAVHALAHGDVATAVDRNVLAVLGATLVVVLWARSVVLRWRGLPRRVARPAWIYAGLALVVVFGVVRNLPFGAGLAP